MRRCQLMSRRGLSLSGVMHAHLFGPMLHEDVAGDLLLVGTAQHDKQENAAALDLFVEEIVARVPGPGRGRLEGGGSRATGCGCTDDRGECGAAGEDRRSGGDERRDHAGKTGGERPTLAHVGARYHGGPLGVRIVRGALGVAHRRIGVEGALLRQEAELGPVPPGAGQGADRGLHRVGGTEQANDFVRLLGSCVLSGRCHGAAVLKTWVGTTPCVAASSWPPSPRCRTPRWNRIGSLLLLNASRVPPDPWHAFTAQRGDRTMARRSGRNGLGAVQQDLARLRSDVNQLVSTVGRMTFRGNPGRAVGQMRTSATRTYGQLSRQAQRYGRTASRTIAAHPVESAALAAMAGAVIIGAMVGRMINRND